MLLNYVKTIDWRCEHFCHKLHKQYDEKAKIKKWTLRIFLQDRVVEYELLYLGTLLVQSISNIIINVRWRFCELNRRRNIGEHFRMPKTKHFVHRTTLRVVINIISSSFLRYNDYLQNLILSISIMLDMNNVQTGEEIRKQLKVSSV